MMILSAKIPTVPFGYGISGTVGIFALHDDIECEDSYCARYAITEGDKPEAHPSEAEWEPNAKPHQEVVTYAVCHVDRLEECGKA